ncbi:GntR family transcriptional regulator [Mobilibacterium timonense]|uniref:GntR family transcriptional regulator n=1 Tax=Mobilibacterium timonense TaxID=1871012 RepID=UPI00098510A8|nr:GntR family transcriptional regulator [Mobilibacterium timonense]
MPSGRTKVVRNSLVDQIYDLIIGKIQNGELSPGDRLNIEALSEEFGVSRTPMRETINRLAQSGYVEMKYNAGPRVSVLDPSKVREIATANTVLLEGMMDLFLSSEDSDVDALCTDLDEIISDQIATVSEEDHTRFSHLSVEFHNRLIQACPNVTLQKFAANTQVQLDMFVSAYQKDITFRQKSISDHKELVSCLRNRNACEFKAALREHNTSPIAYFENMARSE